MENKQCSLPKSYILDGKYKVMFFIKKGVYSETYRVKGTDGKNYFLKLFEYAKQHRTAFNREGDLLEVAFSKKLKHPNLVSYQDNGEFIFENKKFAYLVLAFISGESLTERLTREPIETWYDVKQISSGVLHGLDFLHTMIDPLIHNEIMPQNIMIDMTNDVPQVKITDFSHTRSFHQSTKTYNREGLNLNYLAPECFNNLCSPQTDLFSVGAVMYCMLFGMPPWSVDISKYKEDRIKAEEAILERRKSPLAFPNISNRIVDFNESITRIIRKTLQSEPDNRFQSAAAFLQALNGEIEIDDFTKSKENSTKNKQQQKEKGKGFEDIAGMDELKEQLKKDVIELINDPEGAAMYNIAMPNGMLLYGPPGCGKSFFAEKFAEETQFNFKYVNPSVLASIYVHGTQEKIRDLFNEARENAPFIICLDEVSSVFPKRDQAREHQVGEVDEFLTQLNNCGKDGIFVIATTNFPQNIDEAVLRTGRLGIKIYVPPPDAVARKALFELYLKNVPKDFGFDYAELSRLTENYVASDIKEMVDTIARNCRKDRLRITMEMLIETISKTKPSVPFSIIEKHEEYRKIFESGDAKKERKRVGFI